MLVRRPLSSPRPSLWLALGATLLGAAIPAPAQVRVRQPQGAQHGFLALRSESGALIGHGELIQTVHGSRLTLRLLVHFNDGSVDEETGVYTQGSTFRMINDHHIQRGPFFPHPIDIQMAADGTVISRTPVEGGAPKVETQHLQLPPDTVNGFMPVVLMNLPLASTAPDVTLHYLLPAGKGRMGKLVVRPDGEETFTVEGERRTARIMRIHIELGGIVGVIAPIIGKAPEDIRVSVLPGESPVIIREVVQLGEDTPLVRLEMAGTSFHEAESAPK